MWRYKVYLGSAFRFRKFVPDYQPGFLACRYPSLNKDRQGINRKQLYHFITKSLSSEEGVFVGEAREDINIKLHERLRF